MITSNRADSPRLCPSVRGSPRCLAQRPLPSMTRATCRGMRPAGILGGLAPSGCGSGGRIGRVMLCFPLAGTPPARSYVLHMAQRADRVLQVPLQVGGDQAAALGPVPVLAA